MRRILAGLALGLCAGLAVLALLAVPAARASGDPMEAVIDRELPVSGVPGLAYAVVVDGQITSVGTRGVLRIGSQQQVTPDTAFMTGSISKSFTALSILQLVEAGEVELDRELSRYLSDFSGRPAGEITIRQLLAHTSGYSTVQGNASHTDGTDDVDELARRVERLADDAPAHEPGRRWEYSNANYLILGRVIEVVSGQDYQSYVTDHILVPLGMVHSFVADGRAHESMATGHTPWFGSKRPLAENATSRGMAPAGGVIASATDLARYLQMMLNGSDDVVSAEAKAAMMRPASDVSPFYGLGWFLDPIGGRVWHSGATPGFESLATMVPGTNSGVIVLVNGGSGVGFGDSAGLRNGITAAALGLDGAESSRWAQKALFVALVLLPVGYLLSIVWAWRHRAQLRAKAGPLGLFSLWFPLFTTLIAAWVVLGLVPRQVGSPVATIAVFQPDLALVLIATAVGGVLWAVVRLVLAYARRSG